MPTRPVCAFVTIIFVQLRAQVRTRGIRRHSGFAGDHYQARLKSGRPQSGHGPKNVYFGNTYFRDPNIDARIFDFFNNLFFFSRFSLRYLKTAKKQSKFQNMLKNDQIIIPTFCTSHKRTNIQEIKIN